MSVYSLGEQHLQHEQQQQPQTPTLATHSGWPGYGAAASRRLGWRSVTQLQPAHLSPSSLNLSVTSDTLANGALRWLAVQTGASTRNWIGR